MHRVIVFLFLYFACISSGTAAVWVKVNDNSTSKLLVDRQSILQKDNLTRAWVKIEFKTVQKNIESPDKEYDLSKLLWYFDCTEQKSATSQVFQYMNSRLVHSAGIDIKDAQFIEPVPETELDLAMRFVCATNKSAKPATTAKSVEKKPAANAATADSAKPAETNTAVTAEKAAPPATEQPESKTTEKKPEPATQQKGKDTATKEKDSLAKEGNHDVHWTYEGKEGPENWGKLKSEFAVCDTGRNQSPINIDTAVKASLKPLKGIQKYTAKDIVNNGHTVQVNFKEGNMLLVDGTSFKMKQVHFHAPSENTILGKPFPLEAHFVHADAKGNLTVIGVMFDEGKANAGLEKLWAQIPNEVGAPIPLKEKVSASEMIPVNRAYYRFSGSLTTPPCSEGVRWILMKTPMTASKEQIETFKKAVKHHNNRPVQPLNGRLIVE